MTHADDWGKDPSVQAMRRVFRAMEDAQASLLDRLCVSPFDSRLRSWRERARIAFEATYVLAASAGLGPGKEEAADLYIRCLGRILVADGLEIPEKILPRSEGLERILGEVDF
jgi:predicted trehalose synthase